MATGRCWPLEIVESIVKGLNSDDPEQVEANMKKADQIIQGGKGGKDETEVEGIKTKTS